MSEEKSVEALNKILRSRAKNLLKQRIKEILMTEDSPAIWILKGFKLPTKESMISNDITYGKRAIYEFLEEFCTGKYYHPNIVFDNFIEQEISLIMEALIDKVCPSQ